MGYELHITKKKNWFDEGSDISEQEWRDYVASDSEMKITGFAELPTPRGTTIRIESPLMAEWCGHSKGGVVWFDFRDGHVNLNNPDEEIIGKMQRIAKALGARVQGDEGEFYDA